MAERPLRIAQELATLRPAFITRLGERYRVAYQIGYSRRASNGLGTRPTGTSDPTGDTAAQQEWVRKELDRASHYVKVMAAAADTADKALANVLEPYSDTKVTQRAGELGMYPEEIRAAKKEHRRRVGRKRGRR